MKDSKNKAQIEDEQIDMIGAATEQLAAHLVKVNGFRGDLVLAAMHSEIMRLIAQCYGGAQAADCARKAADRVEGLPSQAEIDLSEVRAQGRA